MHSVQKRPWLNWALRYVVAILVVITAFWLYLAMTLWFGPGLPTYILFYPAVIIVALLVGLGPGLMATIISVMIAGIWIIPPQGQFSLKLPIDMVGAVLFTSFGILISSVTELYRRNRKKAAAYDKERALRATLREKEFLADILQHSSMPFAIGYLDGRLGLLNQAFEQLTGYTTEELHNIDWSTTLTPIEWRKKEKQKLDELHRTGQPIHYEKEYIRKDGTRVPIELLVHIALDTEGKPEYYYSFLMDITDRKRAEKYKQKILEQEQQLTEELSATNEELQATSEELKTTNEDLIIAQNSLMELVNKLKSSNEELEQFAYVASHDLQEPLRMVASFTQLLERRYKDKLDEDADDYISFIVEGANRMKDLIDDLLAFSQLNKESKEFEPVLTEVALDNVLLNLKASIKDNKAQITHDSLPTINGDLSQIHQLLQNLIANAIKFHGDKPPQIHISTKELEKEWLFCISDNGIGISPEHQQQIFNIFKRLHTRDEYHGTGIGLAICKRIVERHGGKIWVESKPRKGSTFYFTILKKEFDN